MEQIPSKQSAYSIKTLRLSACTYTWNAGVLGRQGQGEIARGSSLMFGLARCSASSFSARNARKGVMARLGVAPTHWGWVPPIRTRALLLHSVT